MILPACVMYTYSSPSEVLTLKVQYKSEALVLYGKVQYGTAR